MNRADKLFIVFLIVLSLLSYIPLLIQDWQNKDKQKEVVVQYRNEEVLREDLRKDATYRLQGTLGLAGRIFKHFRECAGVYAVWLLPARHLETAASLLHGDAP